MKFLGAVVIGSFILLIGPLSYFFGADSRLTGKANRAPHQRRLDCKSADKLSTRRQFD